MKIFIILANSSFELDNNLQHFDHKKRGKQMSGSVFFSLLKTNLANFKFRRNKNQIYMRK